MKFYKLVLCIVLIISIGFIISRKMENNTIFQEIKNEKQFDKKSYDLAISKHEFENDKHDLLKEERETSDLIKKEYSSKISLKTRVVSFGQNISSENKTKIVSSFCDSFCEESFLVTVLGIVNSESDDFYDIQSKYNNEWWRYFSGGSYHSMRILKYIKTNSKCLLAVHLVNTKEKILVQKVIDKLGNAWYLGTQIIVNASSNALSFLYKIFIFSLIIFVFYIFLYDK